MRIGIVGSGNIGGALARRLGGLGHDVSVANSRGPDSLRDLVDEAGVEAVTVEEVARAAEIVVVAIPAGRVPDLPAGFLDSAADDAVVVDTGNYYQARDGRIDAIEAGVPESVWVQDHLGRPVVKAFNGVEARLIADAGGADRAGVRVGLAVAGDEGPGKSRVLALVDQLGFDPVDGGPLAQSWRMEPDTPWYGAGLDAEGVRDALARARPRAER